MRLVFDASAGLKVVLPELHSDKARALIDGYMNNIHQLIAPDTYLVECGHAITRAERKKLFSPPDGMYKFNLLSDTCPRLHSHLPLLSRAFELSSLMRHGLFDCLYVALAEREQCALVTADERLALAFPANVISLSSF